MEHASQLPAKLKSHSRQMYKAMLAKQQAEQAVNQAYEAENF